MSKWLPIEKAPKNGKMIVGCISSSKYSYITFMRFDGKGWIVNNKSIEEEYFQPEILGWIPIPKKIYKKHYCESKEDCKIFCKEQNKTLHLHIYDLAPITVEYCPFCGETL